MVHPVTRASLPALLEAPPGRPRHRLHRPDRRLSHPPAGHRRGPCRSRRALPGRVAIRFLPSALLHARLRARDRHARGRSIADTAERTVRSLQPDQARRRGAVSGGPAPDGARGPPVQRLWRRHAGGDVPRPGAARGRATGNVRAPQVGESAKDYVSVAAVIRLLPAIATAGRSPAYNLAAGSNTSHAAIARCLRTHRFGWHVDFAPGAPTVRFPPIDTARLDCRIRRRGKQSFSRPADTGGTWTGGPMLTIDEAGGRVTVCHADGTADGACARHARGVRGGVGRLAALRLGREIRLRLHLDGPPGHPVAGGHDPHSGGHLAVCVPT